MAALFLCAFVRGKRPGVENIGDAFVFPARRLCFIIIIILVVNPYCHEMRADNRICATCQENLACRTGILNNI